MLPSTLAAMPAIARKAGKRSVSKAKKVKNVGLKRTKGVCALPSVGFPCPARRICWAHSCCS